MFRTVVVALFLTVTLIPYLPTTSATDSCAGSLGRQVHIGGQPAVHDFNGPHAFDCCQDLTVIPIAAGTNTFYINVRPPVQHNIADEPHPNALFLQRTTTAAPLGGVNAWLFELEHTAPANLGGAAVSQNAPIDGGSSDVAIRSQTSAWIYQESNGVPGLQTGGGNAVHTDTCHDARYTSTDSLLI